MLVAARIARRSDDPRQWRDITTTRRRRTGPTTFPGVHPRHHGLVKGVEVGSEYVPFEGGRYSIALLKMARTIGGSLTTPGILIGEVA